MAMSEQIHDRHYASCIGGQIVTHQKYERAELGFDDRHNLTFSDHVVEFD